MEILLYVILGTILCLGVSLVAYAGKLKSYFKDQQSSRNQRLEKLFAELFEKLSKPFLYFKTERRIVFQVGGISDDEEGSLVLEKIKRMRLLLKKAYYGMRDKNRVAVLEALNDYEELLVWATARPFGSGVSDDIVDHLSFTFEPYYVLEDGLDLSDHSSCPKGEWRELSMPLLETSEEQFYVNLLDHLAVLVRYSVYEQDRAQLPSHLMQKGLSSLHNLPPSVVREVFQFFFCDYSWDEFWVYSEHLPDLASPARGMGEQLLECLWRLELGQGGVDHQLDKYELSRWEASNEYGDDFLCEYWRYEDYDCEYGVFEPPSYKQVPDGRDSLRQYMLTELGRSLYHSIDFKALIPPRLR
jgi:hypothetical protein